MKEIKYHTIYPVGMIKGNKDQVFTKRGTELTIKVNQKDGSRYIILNRNFRKTQFVNVDKMYMQLFQKTKRNTAYSGAESSSKTQTIFSRGDLKQQNRKGIFIPNQKRSNVISITGFILYGPNKGKKLSAISNDELTWYTTNMQLKNNELIEMNKELEKRGML
jgi:hypothetical protein